MIHSIRFLIFESSKKKKKNHAINFTLGLLLMEQNFALTLEQLVYLFSTRKEDKELEEISITFVRSQVIKL